jgi:hypothetical protein
MAGRLGPVETLVVEVRAWARNHEGGSTPAWSTPVTTTPVIVSLHRLYTGCGQGPAQDVPEQSGTGHVIASGSASTPPPWPW